jgi:class 3 adenylate cyclase/tetratricopeptide (TPR) repeat protein
MTAAETCPACGHANAPGSRFCGGCGTPLGDQTVSCVSCGATNPAGQRFCNACGDRLRSVEGADVARPAPPAPPEHLAAKIRAGRGTLEGERKQVTVLFADVVGSMDLAERTDPEAWRRIMERFLAILCDGIHRFEGTVDKFTGDGIMALFGAPLAHEDHAQRACYAALHLQAELASHAAELRRTEGLNLSVRVGINSGEVVVGAIGEDLGMEYTALGHTVGLAQRMESLAEPGKVYLTRYTASLVEGYFALRDLGEFQVKGVSHPLRVHELTGVGAARGRLDVSRARGFSRFVGRDEELAALESAMAQAADGKAQVIGIVGEAGVGKSRLCHEFAQRCRGRGTPVYHVAGQAHARSVPFLPVLELMRAYFDVTDQDSDQTARERIAGKLLLLDESFADDLPLIFDFLAVPDPERPAPRMDPDARQRQLLGLTKRLIRAQSAREPGVNLFEDLHWVDPGSQAFLANHIEAIQGTRSLTVVNFRPEYHASWMSKSYYRQIALVPLGPEAIEEMLGDLLGSDPSLDGLPELVRERTGGNPFFIEEVVQSLVEAGSLEGERGAYRLARPVEDATVPASVQAVLSARIDRLAEREKAVLQAAAVVGKEFPEPVLGRVVELQRTELEEALRSLVAGEFVYEQELYPEAVYAFKHPLTQEVTYGSQLGDRRALVHAGVARAIAEQYPERLDEQAALLAQHWEAAGEALEAARWNARAGAWAGTNDPRQSLRHWRRVRELADSLPESPETMALGLSARIFSLTYGWRLGISVEEAKALFTEAERLAARTQDIRSRALLLSMYGAIKGLSEGDLLEFARLGREAIALAEESGDPALYLALSPSSYPLYSIGEFGEAVRILDRAIELANGDPTVGAGIGFGCPYAYCMGFKGGALVNLGRLEEARNLIEGGMKIAGEQGDVESVGWCHMWHAWLDYARGDSTATLAHAQKALEIAERIGDSFSRAWAWLWVGFAQRLGGDWQRAIEATERSLRTARERRVAIEGDPFRLAVLAESYLGLGQAQRARDLAEEGLMIARERGQPSFEGLAALALARVLLSSSGGAGGKEIEDVLSSALERLTATGQRGLEPMVHVELAELARQRGDEEQWERELREAHRLFTEIGATAHTERIADQLSQSERVRGGLV